MNYAQFQLTLKALIFKDSRILIVITKNGYIDFPGGRINEDEVMISHEDCLEREVYEELGSDVSFKIGRLEFLTNRLYEADGITHYVVAAFYKTDNFNGQIDISDEHTHFKWLTPEELLAEDPSKFVSSDEYLQVKNYLNGLVK